MEWNLTDITQGTTEWRLARLGRFTGSRIGELMRAGRRNTRFGEVASNYLDKVIGERMIDRNNIAPDEWEELFKEIETRPTREMLRGMELEPLARAAWAEHIGESYRITPGGLWESADGSCGDSPDALAYAGELLSIVAEFKCPGIAVHAKALYTVQDNESLYDFSMVYYWQCMMHLWATGAPCCDWVSYDPRCRVPLHVVRIRRDEEAIEKLALRIMEAEEEIARRMDIINRLNINR